MKALLAGIAFLAVLFPAPVEAAGRGCNFMNSPVPGIPIIYAADSNCLAGETAAVISTYVQLYGSGAAWHWAADHNRISGYPGAPPVCDDGTVTSCLPLEGSGANAIPQEAMLGCHFVLGFKTLHDAMPETVGDCLDHQAFTSNGDARQHTTKGLLAWRKSDNWTAFTNGYMTWINGPNGIVQRLNTVRFPWEHDVPASTTQAISAAPSLQPVVALLMQWDANHSTHYMLNLAEHGITLDIGPLLPGILAQYSPADAHIRVSDSLRMEDVHALASVVAYMSSDALDVPPGKTNVPPGDCYQAETRAWEHQAEVWLSFYPGLRATPVTFLASFLNDAVRSITVAPEAFGARLHVLYRCECG